MNIVTLVIGEKYQNAKIDIDISSFNYGGMVQYAIDDRKRDSVISFVLADIEKTDMVVQMLRDKLTLTVDKEIYVRSRKEFTKYDSDHRPRVIVRLPSGYENIASPPDFHFRSVDVKTLVVNAYVEGATTYDDRDRSEEHFKPIAEKYAVEVLNETK